LVDEGRSTAEILDLRQRTPFATLVKTELGQRLAGSWDTTRFSTPIGRYWTDLYELRIRVVHSGYLPHDGDAEQAERGFEGLDTFVDERLGTKVKRYPSAVVARNEIAEATQAN